MNDKIVDEMINYLEDIIDTSLKYISDDKKVEYLNNVVLISQFHKENIQYLNRNNEV